MNILKHYKMFKKGKNWCFMAIATVAVAFGAMNISAQANADTNGTDEQVATTQVQSAANSTRSSSTTSIKDSAVSSDATSASASTSVASTASASSQPTQAATESVSTAQATAPQVNTNLKVAAAQPNQNNGWQLQDGSVYYYRNGQKLTGVQTIDGAQYYFNDQGQQQKDYFLNQGNHTYYFQKNGQRLNDGFYQNWGHTYYFQKDGARLDDGFYQNWGHMYYFGDGGVRLDDGFYQNWGHTYYFQKDGARLDDGFYQNWGHMYYFGDGGVRLDNSFYKNWGHTYYFGSDGARWDNRFYNNWGHSYYFQGDGALATNTNIWGDGSEYHADWNGILSPITAYNNGINRYILNHGITPAGITYDYVIPNVTGNYSGTSNGKPNMVVVHETANPNDSIWGEINFERANYNNAFVHAFVDADHIIQISNTDHEAWGAAYPANGRAIQFEQVEVYGAWNFARELVNAAYYTAYNMKKYGLTPSLAQGNATGTLWSHHNVSQYLGGTDHTDPDGYWYNRAQGYFGTSYSMSDFLQLVNYEYSKLN